MFRVRNTLSMISKSSLPRNLIVSGCTSSAEQTLSRLLHTKRGIGADVAGAALDKLYSAAAKPFRRRQPCCVSIVVQAGTNS